MATVQIEAIDQLFAGFRARMQASVDALATWWRTIEPALNQFAQRAVAFDEIQRAQRRRMHADYGRRLRARRRRGR
jgi:hypothetical protein